MSQNKNRKSKYKNNNNAKEQKVNHTITESEEELDEADRILQELDEMEERKNSDISSKVRDLIKNDKEAIRDYNAKIEPDISEVEEDNNEALNEDEMDYLDDELVQEQDSREDTDLPKPKIENEKRNSKKRKNNKKKNNQNTEKNTQSIDIEKEESEEEDFLASLDKRTEKIVNEKIRKNQPNRLKSKKDSNEESHIFISTIRDLAMSGIKNMVVMVSIIGLLLILVATMILDRNNTGTDKEYGSFLDIDTAKIISLNNDYYAALGEGDITKIREYIENTSGISDDILLEKVEEARVYKDYIAEDFKIINCYIQAGLEKNEYIVHYKFELKIKNVETAAVGMIPGYLINVSEDEKNPKYEICTLSTDSKRYDYMIKMSNCSNVTKLYNQTDKELEKACERDEKLKNVVEALKNMGKKTPEMTTTSDKESTNPSENTTEAMTEK